MVQNARNFRCFLHRRSPWLEGSKQLPSLGKAWCSWRCMRFALIPTQAFLHQKTCTSFSVSPWCSSLQRSEHWACDTAVHNVNHKLFIAELFLNVKISIQLFFFLFHAMGCHISKGSTMASQWLVYIIALKLGK